MSKNSHSTILVSFLVVPLFFSGMFADISLCKEKAPPPVTLEFWSVFDDSDIYAPLIASFQQQYPYITVNYRKKNIASYEQELLDALASGRGPDIFSVNNFWMPRYFEKLTPVPDNLIALSRFLEVFPDVARQDFVLNEKIYALPLSIDTLALFYNKDLLNSAGVALLPKTWEEFNAATEKLTQKDEQGEISQAGAALGASRNINRSTDILALLMIQSGSQMVSLDKTEATFADSINLNGENFRPGSRALSFYSNFASPSKKVYSWNSRQHYSLDAFSQGEVAMMISYSYQIPVLRAKAPHLDFGVAALPQISQKGATVSYANYWGQAVSKGSQNSAAAWQFIAWLAQPENSIQYLQATQKPASRRDLIDQQNDPELSVFAKQVLTARSWWQTDSAVIEKIFADMIDRALSSPSLTDEIVKDAEVRVTELMRNK